MLRILPQRATVKLLVAMVSVVVPYLHADVAAGTKAFNDGDYQTALQEWTPLADQGDGAAQYNLGLLYERGLGIAPDPAKAAGLYLRAANQGSTRAMTSIGALYATGVGVKQSYRMAFIWFYRAARQTGVGAASAVKNRDRAAAYLSEGERAEAVREALSWRPVPTAKTLEADGLR